MQEGVGSDTFLRNWTNRGRRVTSRNHIEKVRKIRDGHEEEYEEAGRKEREERQDKAPGMHPARKFYRRVELPSSFFRA